jgi:hypothetical protein
MNVCAQACDIRICIALSEKERDEPWQRRKLIHLLHSGAAISALGAQKANPMRRIKSAHN